MAAKRRGSTGRGKRNSMVRGAACRSPSTVSVTMQPPFLDDGDAVDDALHLVELVGREEDRATLGDRLPDDARELLLHQRVESGGRLVEYQELWSMHQGEHDADLLPVPLGERPHGAVEHDAEALDELVEEGPCPSCPARGPRSRRDGGPSGAGAGQAPPADSRSGDGWQRRRGSGRDPAPSRLPRWAGTGPAAGGWSWTCPRRWGRGSRRPLRGRPRSGGRRCPDARRRSS